MDSQTRAIADVQVAEQEIPTIETGLSDLFVCPRCDSAYLLPVEVLDIDLQVCSDCGGVWLMNRVSDRLLAPLFGALDQCSRLSCLSCPSCSRTMREWTVRRADIVLDSCDDHGTWFDFHETEALSWAAAKMRGERPPGFATARHPEPEPDALAATAAALAALAVTHADALHTADLAKRSNWTSKFTKPDDIFAVLWIFI